MCYFSDNQSKSITLTGKKASVKKAKADVESVIEELESQEKDFAHIKQKKDEKERLLAVAVLNEVLYPDYWKCLKEGNPNTMGEGKLVVLESQSKTYTEIEKLVMGTWESSKVGHGTDAANLCHKSVAVRKIWRFEHPKLYRQYDTRRKLMCMERLKKSYPAFSGLNGEHEVVTRTLGMFYLLIFFVPNTIDVCPCFQPIFQGIFVIHQNHSVL